MTTFWIIAGLLVVGALLFVVPPLLLRSKSAASVKRSEMNLSIYRDQLRELDSDLASGALNEAQYQAAKNELERRALEDAETTGEEAATQPGGRWVAVAAIVAIPVLTVTLYLLLGKPEEMAPKSGGANQAQGVGQAQIEEMVAGLAKKLKDKPDDAEGWEMLGRSYATLRRFGDSSAAYARAAALSPNNAQLLTDYADVLAMVNGRNIQGEPEKIILQALRAEPNNIKALALAGSAAFQRHDYRKAIDWWQQILKLVPPDSQIARTATANISQAQGLSGQPLGGLSKAGAAGKLSGKVSLDPALKSRVTDTDTVFIFARDADAQRPPLAVLRKTVKELPLAFTLDDSMAPMPNFKLSSAVNVVVSARVSRSGNAMPAPGDLQGSGQPVKNGAAGVSIIINSEIK
ncbi:MAG: c-type cytochrome biogenesis protein CcmI [Nitrosomonadales bacterium]|nr:c-type cytochrome biogenesis protein CcmI [Nitrosomonadales bacterium]